MKSEDTDIEDILSREPEDRGSARNQMAPKGRHQHAVEVLSSDSASEDCLRPRAKYYARRRGPQQHAKGRETTSQRRTRRMETRSPSMSPESSHLMDYSYEEDTPSIGGASPTGETTFTKLRWPSDLGAALEDKEAGNKSDINDLHCATEHQNKQQRKKVDVDISLEEADESGGEDIGRNPDGTESEGEEIPVLPKVPMKRKVLNQQRVCERRTQRGRTKSTSPQTKKQRTPQIDASVITQLQFGRRPLNCVSVPTSQL